MSFKVEAHIDSWSKQVHRMALALFSLMLLSTAHQEAGASRVLRWKG